MDLTGRHHGKYELPEKVGQGGMAYVYRAHQPTIERFVAVKVPHSHLTVEANTGLAEIKMFVAGEGTGGIIIGDIRPFRA